MLTPLDKLLNQKKALEIRLAKASNKVSNIQSELERINTQIQIETPKDERANKQAYELGVRLHKLYLSNKTWTEIAAEVGMSKSQAQGAFNKYKSGLFQQWLKDQKLNRRKLSYTNVDKIFWREVMSKSPSE